MLQAAQRRRHNTKSYLKLPLVAGTEQTFPDIGGQED